MKQYIKKWVAVILSCCLCLGIWSAAAFAAGTGEFDPAGNLLPNPGMEEGGSDQNEWLCDDNTFSLNLTTGNDTFAPHSGDSCMGYLQYNSDKPTLIYQEVEIPVSGIYEFSGYFATIAELVTIRIGDSTVSFSNNGRVWDKKNVLFEASAGESVLIEITSLDPTQVGFWMDDVCLTLCEGTSLEGVWDEWNMEGDIVQDPEIAMQGEYCAYVSGGNSLNLMGPSLESGEYILTFSVRTLDENSIPCVFRVHSLTSGEVYETEPMELANQWKSVTIRMQDPGEVAFAIENFDAPDVFIDNISLVRFDDFWPNPDPQPQELLANRGFESGLSGWMHQGASLALTTTSQAHSGSQSVFMGYFASEAFNSYLSQDITSGCGTYDFSAYIKTETNLIGTGAFLLLEAKDANGRILASAASPAISNSNGAWAFASARLNAPAGTKTVTAKIGGLYCSGGFYVDDASLQYSK